MRNRILSLRIIVPLFLAVLVPITAFCKTDENLSVLLNDALYSLNRYEELTSSVNCDSWKAPEKLRHLCADAIRRIGKNVHDTKIVLARSLKARTPSSVDLLDIYAELEETEGHLYELANNVSDFHGEDGIPFSAASAKTQLVAANLYVQLRGRLLSEEHGCQGK
jgi:hypothetical protein